MQCISCLTSLAAAAAKIRPIVLFPFPTSCEQILLILMKHLRSLPPCGLYCNLQVYDVDTYSKYLCWYYYIFTLPSLVWKKIQEALRKTNRLLFFDTTPAAYKMKIFGVCPDTHRARWSHKPPSIFQSRLKRRLLRSPCSVCVCV
jgi:hypothetical protein